MATLVVVEHGGSAPKAVAVAAPSQSQTVSAPQAVTAWLDASGQAQIDNLRNVYALYTSDLSDYNAARTSDDCQSMNNYGSSDRMYPPIPDAQAEADWTAALELFDEGGQGCVASIERLDLTQTSTVASQLQQADDDLTQTIARITALTGVTVS